MYVDDYADGHVGVTYISAHTNHELGDSELPHLPLPESVKEEVAMKVSKGIPPERIQKGNDPLAITITTLRIAYLLRYQRECWPQNETSRFRSDSL